MFDGFFEELPQNHTLELACIPSLTELERALHVAKDTAAGVDGFQGRFCKEFAKPLARAYMPLLT
eukprot:8579277-Pyramimonas_sp.AAC.1